MITCRNLYVHELPQPNVLVHHQALCISMQLVLEITARVHMHMCVKAFERAIADVCSAFSVSVAYYCDRIFFFVLTMVEDEDSISPLHWIWVKKVVEGRFFEICENHRTITFSESDLLFSIFNAFGSLLFPRFIGFLYARVGGGVGWQIRSLFALITTSKLLQSIA